jgi:hypothetical protein
VGAAFDVVFGLFLLAMAVLVVVTVRWAVRRGRAPVRRDEFPDDVPGGGGDSA